LAGLCFQSVTGAPFSVREKADFRAELRAKDKDKVAARLEQLAAGTEGVGSQESKLLLRLLEFQNADEWRGQRGILKEVTRAKLAEMKAVLPDFLSEKDPEKAEQLVLMGKLYEKELHDRKSAGECYTRIIRRLLWAQRIPESLEDWRFSLADLDYHDDLSAEERHAIRRLKILIEEEGIILARIAERIDQKILAAQAELYDPPAAPPFEPYLPVEELTRRHLEGNGGAQ